MNFIIDFYQNLDALNLILFWGVIIVVLLLLIFSIIIANKNRELKEMLRSREYNYSPIKRDETDIPIIKNQTNENIENTSNIIDESKNIIEEENNFVAEEHVINYNDNFQYLNNTQEVKSNNVEKEIANQNTTVNMPYQRNVLREMSLNQTSPIGIISKQNPDEMIKNNATELQDSLNYSNFEDNTNSEYLKEVSQKLSNATNNDDTYRTEYEIRQEEEAIISYKELMEKKDLIKTIDEEEAVISIEELMEKKKEEQKLYNLTDNAENDNFINELKHFRNDL